MKKLTLLSLALLAVISIAGLSSCAKAGGASAKKAKISFEHTSFNTGSLDFYLDGTKENSSPIAYQNGTPYTAIAAGSHTIMATLDANSATLIDTTFTLAENTPYSVYVIDTAPNIGALILNDSLATPPSGMANIRIVNLVPNAPAYDVAIVGGATIGSNLNFKDNSGFVTVTPGNLSLQISLALGGTVLGTFPAINFPSGKGYTLCITGIAGKGLSPVLFANL